MDNEVSEGGAGGRCCGPSEGLDTRDLWATRCEDHEGARIERSRASIGIDSASGNREPTPAMAEGENGTQDHAGVSAYQKTLLGTTYVGTRVLFVVAPGT